MKAPDFYDKLYGMYMSTHMIPNYYCRGKARLSLRHFASKMHITFRERLTICTPHQAWIQPVKAFVKQTIAFLGQGRPGWLSYVKTHTTVVASASIPWCRRLMSVQKYVRNFDFTTLDETKTTRLWNLRIWAWIWFESRQSQTSLAYRMSATSILMSKTPVTSGYTALAPVSRHN